MEAQTKKTESHAPKGELRSRPSASSSVGNGAWREKAECTKVFKIKMLEYSGFSIMVYMAVCTFQRWPH